jgi:hypothetical protein
MATKETKPAEAAAPAGTAVVTWKDRMAAVVAQSAQSEAPKGGFLSFKAGTMSYDETPIPGNRMEVIVIDFLLENAMFRDKYNPMKTVSPMCYAFGREEEELRPHEDSEEPQHTDCATCPNNEWGSDPEGGRGKACKNSRRIAIISADCLTKGIDAIRKANVVMCKIPVTSIKNFSRFVNQCTGVMQAPPFQLITELSVAPHPANLFEVKWKVIEKIESQDVLEALYAKRQSIERQMFQPYPANEEAAAPAPRGGKAKY